MILPDVNLLIHAYDSGATGHAAANLTTDAHLAALAIEHGYTLYSFDADFGRFNGLKWRNPLSRSARS